jgi:hypothetical protein
MIGDLEMLTSAERISRRCDGDVAHPRHSAGARRPSRTRTVVARVLRARVARAPQPRPGLPELLGRPSISQSLR